MPSSRQVSGNLRPVAAHPSANVLSWCGSQRVSTLLDRTTFCPMFTVTRIKLRNHELGCRRENLLQIHPRVTRSIATSSLQSQVKNIAIARTLSEINSFWEKKEPSTKRNQAPLRPSEEHVFAERNRGTEVIIWWQIWLPLAISDTCLQTDRTIWILSWHLTLQPNGAVVLRMSLRLTNSSPHRVGPQPLEDFNEFGLELFAVLMAESTTSASTVENSLKVPRSIQKLFWKYSI